MLQHNCTQGTALLTETLFTRENKEQVQENTRYKRTQSTREHEVKAITSTREQKVQEKQS